MADSSDSAFEGADIIPSADFPYLPSGSKLEDFDPNAPSMVFPTRDLWSQSPYRSIVTVRSQSSAGTGFAIGHNLLLTAAHVVARGSKPLAELSARFLGELAGVPVIAVWIDSRWNGEAGSTGDMAILKVSHEVPALPLSSPALDAWASVSRLFIAGHTPDQFAQDRIAVSPGSWFDFRLHPSHVYYVASTLAGQSGAPVFAFRKRSTGERLVSAIHLGPGALRNPPGKNFGAMIEVKRFAFLDRQELPDEPLWKLIN